MGRLRRSALRASRWRVSSFSLASSSLRAASHSSRVAIRGSVTAILLGSGARAILLACRTAPPGATHRSGDIRTPPWSRTAHVAFDLATYERVVGRLDVED